MNDYRLDSVHANWNAVKSDIQSVVNISTVFDEQIIGEINAIVASKHRSW